MKRTTRKILALGIATAMTAMVVGCGGQSAGETGQTTQPVSAEGSKEAETAEAASQGSSQESAGAVSYTHLDVYKRQDSNSSGAAEPTSWVFIICQRDEGTMNIWWTAAFIPLFPQLTICARR